MLSPCRGRLIAVISSASDIQTPPQLVRVRIEYVKFDSRTDLSSDVEQRSTRDAEQVAARVRAL